jgi:hypothetical protein
MKEFFEHPAVQATCLISAVLGIAQVVVPYLVAPVSLVFSPLIGIAAGAIAALLVISALATKSAAWKKSSLVICFFANGVLFALTIGFQLFLYVITSAERAGISVFTNRMYGIVLTYLELLPVVYSFVIAVCFYSGMSGLYWLYRWMKV